jgi:hypothetical protein
MDKPFLYKPIENFVDLIKNKKIIGIGENVHGSKESWQIRFFILFLLVIHGKDIIIFLEENNDYLKSFKNFEKNKENLFFQHNTLEFQEFYSFYRKNIIGIDNHFDSKIRNKWMARDIIKNINHYSKTLKNPIFVFLGFDSHISNYDISKNTTNDKKWIPNESGYSEKKEVGAYLKDKFGDDYLSIGLISKGGITYGKESGDWNWKKIKFSNLSPIQRLKNNQFYFSNNTKNYKYAGLGPLYVDDMNTKWLDCFYIIPKSTPLTPL